MHIEVQKKHPRLIEGKPYHGRILLEKMRISNFLRLQYAVFEPPSASPSLSSSHNFSIAGSANFDLALQVSFVWFAVFAEFSSVRISHYVKAYRKNIFDKLHQYAL